MNDFSTVFSTVLANSISILKGLTDEYRQVRFASSLGAEDMVLIDIIARNQLRIEAFTLDTGRLNKETYDLMSLSKIFNIKVIFPQADRVQHAVALHGINGFYDSVQARKDCCAARKIEPLKRALAGADAWVTGLRSSQSDARQALSLVAFDSATQLPKCNPLLDWSSEQIWAYIEHNKVPFNALHSQGYPSIGCAPCTRAVSADEHPRAGRWWWEQDNQKECGLHIDDSGKLIRTYQAPKKELNL
jgi:phosphoadenosine phosphosulfate reductase